MATYYIGADVHCNNTELAVEKGGKIVARYSVPTTIPGISTVLSSLEGKKIFAMDELSLWHRNRASDILCFFICSSTLRINSAGIIRLRLSTHNRSRKTARAIMEHRIMGYITTPPFTIRLITLLTPFIKNLRVI